MDSPWIWIILLGVALTIIGPAVGLLIGGMAGLYKRAKDGDEASQRIG